MKFLNGLLVATLLTVAVPVCAQSLGDLAKKEQERRKTLPPAAKTYTNEDLKRLTPMPGGETPSKPEPAKAGDPAKPTEVKPDAPAADGTAKDEKYWRGRITAAKEDIRRNEMFRDALQTRVNALSADFAGRDDPFQRAKIADDRQKALAEMARVTEEIAKATKAVADIGEEARRAGVPPGWLR